MSKTARGSSGRSAILPGEAPVRSCHGHRVVRPPMTRPSGRTLVRKPVPAVGPMPEPRPAGTGRAKDGSAADAEPLDQACGSGPRPSLDDSRAASGAARPSSGGRGGNGCPCAWVLKWPVRLLIRSVRIATWTSGEPVSPAALGIFLHERGLALGRDRHRCVLSIGFLDEDRPKEPKGCRKGTVGFAGGGRAGMSSSAVGPRDAFPRA